MINGAIAEVECEEGFEPKNCTAETANQCDKKCGVMPTEEWCATQACDQTICVCKDGLYKDTTQDGDRCIKQEDCGCNHPDYGYLAVNTCPHCPAQTVAKSRELKKLKN